MGFEKIGTEVLEIAKKVSESLKLEEIDKRINIHETKIKKETSITVEEFIDKRIDVNKSSVKGNKEVFTGKIDKIKEYNDRINQAKASEGKWSGEIGESILTLNTGEKIEYKNGYPNFDKYSKGDVKINNMTSDKDINWANAKKAYAEKWNKECKDGKSDWTPKDVAKYKQDNHLIFHECEDMKTCQLIPEHIHENAHHFGGRHECKIRGK